MINYKEIADALRSTVENYEAQLREIDKFLEEKGLLEDYKAYADRKELEKTAEIKKEIEDDKREDEKHDEALREEQEKEEEEEKKKTENSVNDHPLVPVLGGVITISIAARTIEMMDNGLRFMLHRIDNNTETEAEKEHEVRFSYDDRGYFTDTEGHELVLTKIQRRLLLRQLAQIPKIAPDTGIAQNVSYYLRPVSLAIRHSDIVREYPSWEMEEIEATTLYEYLSQHPEQSEEDYYDMITDCALRDFISPDNRTGKYFSAYGELYDAYDDDALRSTMNEIVEYKKSREEDAQTKNKDHEKKRVNR